MKHCYKAKANRLIGIAGLSILSFTSEAQITVANNQTAQSLVDMLVGPGVTTSNAVLNCSGNASGKFSGPSNLGIDSGIVLGTGMASTNGASIGLNGLASQSVALGAVAGTDADLTAMQLMYVPTGSGIQTPCSLEFDFVPKGDTVRFDYVFASEEYNTYVCQNVSDMFALLISGPSIVPNGPFTNKRNVALIPGTSTPVMINTINAGNNIAAPCTNIDPSAPYTQYFINNINLGGTTVAYNGFTTVLTAEAVVIPCETYHLKFAVSNVSDAAFQSAVMLKAGSLTSTNVQTQQITGGGANTNRMHVVRGCKSAQLQYQRTDCDTMFPFDFHLEIGGTAVPGVHYETIPNTLHVPGGTSIGNLFVKGLLGAPTGERYVTIGVKHPDSILVGAAIVPIIQRDTVWIYDSLYINIPTAPTTVCPNTQITIEADLAPTLDFSWVPAQYNTGSLTIQPNMLTTRAFTITATQPGAPNTCPPNSRTYVGVVEQYPIISASTDTVVCVADTVSLPVAVSPDSLNYVFKWTPSNGLRADNIGTNYFSQPPGIYYYDIRVSTPVANCTRNHSIKITAVLPEKFTSVSPISGTTYDYNSMINFEAIGNFRFYTWYPSELFDDPFNERNYTKALESRNFQVVGIDQYGCMDTANVFVNVNFPGFVMPNAFTPNGDGKNDVFKIPSNHFSKIQKFEIYNRWGQMVFSTQDANRGWNGIDVNNGKVCEQGTYMYILIAETPDKDIKTIKGDISLIR